MINLAPPILQGSATVWPAPLVEERAESGVLQNDATIGLESPFANHVCRHREPPRDQRRPAPALQDRAALEDELAPDARPDQPDLSVSHERLVAGHVPGDGESVAVQGRPVLAAQASATKSQSAPDSE